MPAAAVSSMANTKSVSPICAASSAVMTSMRSHRVVRPPGCRKGAGLLHAFEARRNVELSGQPHGDRGTSWNDGFQGPPVTNPPGTAFDELAEGDGHRGLVDAGALDVTADAIELGPSVLLRAKRGVPLGAVLENEWNVGKGLHVVHGGRTAVQADHGG